MLKQTFKNIEDSLNDLLKSYNLPDNEYLLRNVTALVENIKIDQEIRKRKAKFKEKKRKKGFFVTANNSPTTSYVITDMQVSPKSA